MMELFDYNMYDDHNIIRTISTDIEKNTQNKFIRKYFNFDSFRKLKYYILIILCNYYS